MSRQSDTVCASCHAGYYLFKNSCKPYGCNSDVCKTCVAQKQRQAIEKMEKRLDRRLTPIAPAVTLGLCSSAGTARPFDSHDVSRFLKLLERSSLCF